MKPLLTVKLYDSNIDVCADICTDKVTEVWKLLKDIDFTGGTIRADYNDGMYNEASFKDARQAKVLTALFREKSLLAYLYNGELV